MGRLESKKNAKKLSLFDNAFKLFTTKGLSNTSISDITTKAGIAKGTFYLYFKDKYDIHNKLIVYETSKLLESAHFDLMQSMKQGNTMDYYEVVIFIINHIIDDLSSNKVLLKFISKHISINIFKQTIVNDINGNEVSLLDAIIDLAKNTDLKLKDPEIMLYFIVELLSSTICSPIIDNEPSDIDSIKPYLFRTIRFIINDHIVTSDK